MGFLDPIPYHLAKSGEVKFPRMAEVEQSFPDIHVDDIRGAVRDALASVSMPDIKGKSIALTAGSRGIPNIAEIIGAVGEELYERGARPFVIPAMGSHGNATAEGQVELLASLGVTEEAVGMPIRASMETVELGITENGVRVFCDRIAYDADYIVPCGRVKAHTDFRGKVESGLCKMITVGLGKYDGATAFHKTGTGEMGERLFNAARLSLSKLNILCCVAIIDNAHHMTKRIEAVRKEDVLMREPELLKEANGSMARVLIDEVDVLIVDRFGKEISGCGMDPNITGRFLYAPDSHFDGTLRATKIVTMRLTEDSHGNASGVGGADFIPLKFAREIDLSKVYTNCLTSRNSLGGKIPMVMNSDLDTIYAAASSCGARSVQDVRIVRIKDTLDLGRIMVSENMLPEIAGRSDMKVVSEPRELAFDENGDLRDLP